MLLKRWLKIQPNPGYFYNGNRISNNNGGKVSFYMGVVVSERFNLGVVVSERFNLVDAYYYCAIYREYYVVRAHLTP